jgi:general secretion pathway protein K
MAIKSTAALFWFSPAKLRSDRTFQQSFRPGLNSNQAGFALIAVIWSLGLIVLLGTAVIVGARYRTRMASNYLSVTAAAAAAESAINLAIAARLTKRSEQSVKFPLRCQMPSGESVTVTVDDEAGKVDLNAATPATLSHLFSALTVDQATGARIATSILQFRNPTAHHSKNSDAQSAKNNSDDANKPGFTTIMQLDQIGGISPVLFRSAQRFVTVRSGRSEPNSGVASPRLRELLNLEQIPAAPTDGLPELNVTIRADVIAADGAHFIREALVSFGPEDGRPFMIREWRRGNVEATQTSLTKQSGKGTANRCFRIGQATGS